MHAARRRPSPADADQWRRSEPRARPILLQRDFGVFWTTALLSTSGMWLWRITSPILLFELTGSPLMLGLLSLASYGPLLAFSFVGGMLADRFPRRIMIACCQSFTAALFMTLAVVGWTVGFSPQLIFVVAVAEGTSYALAKPSLQALVYEFVEPGELSRAVAVNTAQFTIAQLIGPTIATGLVIVGGHSLALGAATLLYLPLVGAMFVLRPSGNARRTLSTARGRELLRDGLAAIRVPGTAALLIVVAIGSVALEGGVRVLAPQFATVALSRPESTAGLIISGQAVGATLAVLLVGAAVRRWDDIAIARSGFVMMGVGLVAYALSPNLGIALPLAALVGAAQAMTFSVVTALIHRVTLDDVRGRVMAVHAMALLGMRPVAGLIAGSLSAVLGPRLASATFMLLTLVGVGIVGRLRALMSPAAARNMTADLQDETRRFQDDVHEPEPASASGCGGGGGGDRHGGR